MNYIAIWYLSNAGSESDRENRLMNADATQIKAMLEMAASRTLLEVPTKTRNDLLRVESNPAHHIIMDAFYVLFAITSKMRMGEIHRRASRYGSPFPGLITTSPNGDSVCIVVAKDGRVHLQGVQVEGFDYCVGMQGDATLILEDFRYKPVYVRKSLRVNLAYAVSFGEEIRPGNVHEYMEDLFVYHINNYRELRQNADVEKRLISAPS